MEWTTYSSNDCSNSTLSATYLVNSTYQNGKGTYWDFDCSSNNSYYASINFTITPCEAGDISYVTMDAVVGVCTLHGPIDGEKSSNDWLGIEVYCEENWAELQYYDVDDTTTYTVTCNDSLLTSISNATDECGFILKTQGTNVYGYVCQRFI